MDHIFVARQNLEIAIQTVLHRYQTELEVATKSNDCALIQEMAGEITKSARLFQAITENTAKELEDDDE